MKTAPRLLITGAGGQLGQALKKAAAAYPACSFCFCPKNQLDLTDHLQTTAFIKKYRPTVLINTAAYTNVDQAQSNREKAYQLNSLTPGLSITSAIKGKSANTILPL